MSEDIEDSNRLLKGSIGNINSIEDLDNLNINSDGLLVKNSKKRNIFKKSKNDIFIPFVIFIILSIIALIAFIVYFILYNSINKVNRLLLNENVMMTYNDPRFYEVVELNNKIKAALISYHNTTICSIGITIKTEKEEIMGMANLIKHLFERQLTKKLMNVLTRNYGKFNSIFRDDSMSFSFEVEKSGFNKALEIFSNCLTNFNVSKDNITTEIKSIQKEYERNLLDKDILEKPVLHSIIFNTTGGYFPLGNKESLSGDIYDKVYDYVNRTFVGKNIQISLYSNLRSNLIKGLAIKYFSSLPSDNNITNEIEKNEDLHLGKVAYFQLEDYHYKYFSVSFYFDKKEFPQCEYYLKYIQYLFNHKGKDSLYNDLFIFGYIRSMSTSISNYSPNVVEFKIKYDTIISLLKDQPVNETLLFTFNFLKIIKESNHTAEHEMLYNEFLNISKINFYYQHFPNDLSSYAQDISYALYNYSSSDIKQFTVGNYYLPPFNAEILNKIIQHFNYKNCIILVGAQDTVNLGDFIFSLAEKKKSELYNTRKEKWYKTEYSYDNLIPEKIKEYEDFYMEDILHMRPSNKFITKATGPRNSYEKYNSEGGVTPNLIFSDRHINIYHKLDLYFKEPKVSMMFHLVTNFTRPMLEEQGIYNLYHFALIKLLLESKLSDAIDAGNTIQMINNENGIQVNLNVYSDLFEDISKEVTDVLFHIENETSIPKGIIPNFINDYLYSIENERKSEKYFNYYKIIMKQNVTNIYKLTAPIQDFSEDEVLDAIPHSINCSLLIACFYGDIDEKEVLKLYEERINGTISPVAYDLIFKVPVINEFKYLDYLHTQFYFKGSYILRFKRHKKYSEKYNLISNNFLLGNYTADLDNALNIIKILWRGMFSTYAAENKVGYYTSYNKYIFDGMIYLNFIIESGIDQEVGGANGTNTKADKILEQLITLVKDASDDDIYLAKESLIANYWKNETSLEERTARIFNSLYLNITDFEKKNMNRDSLSKYTKEYLVNTLEYHLIHNVTKLSIQLMDDDEVTGGPSEEYPLNKTIHAEIIPDSFDFISGIANDIVRPLHK